MIDLHVHTTYSDGVLTPMEILNKASEIGIDVLAITDHNTMEGVSDIFVNNKNIRVIYGIELTAFDLCERHYLGYFNHNVTEGIEQFLDGKREQYTNEMKSRFEKLIDKGFDLVEEDMIANEVYSAKQLCISIFEKGYTSTLDDAYLLAFGLDKNHYRSLWQASSKECIELIKKLGGCPILAHPGHYHSIVTEDEIKTYRDYGLLGVECFHPNHSDNQKQLFLQICNKYELLITGGSDYHGDNKHPQQLGDEKIDDKVCKNFLNYMSDFNYM